MSSGKTLWRSDVDRCLEVFRPSHSIMASLDGSRYGFFSVVSLSSSSASSSSSSSTSSCSSFSSSFAFPLVVSSFSSPCGAASSFSSSPFFPISASSPFSFDFFSAMNSSRRKVAMVPPGITPQKYLESSTAGPPTSCRSTLRAIRLLARRSAPMDATAAMESRAGRRDSSTTDHAKAHPALIRWTKLLGVNCTTALVVGWGCSLSGSRRYEFGCRE
mmetsp:Transcript_22753/g.47465  ORF Transcript_22753/g.47465 Transcript_22753/m.47465 type:complete len:217 (+) Transcript_22753:467-1117(+)